MHKLRLYMNNMPEKRWPTIQALTEHFLENELNDTRYLIDQSIFDSMSFRKKMDLGNF